MRSARVHTPLRCAEGKRDGQDSRARSLREGVKVPVECEFTLVIGPILIYVPVSRPTLKLVHEVRSKSKKLAPPQNVLMLLVSDGRKMARLVVQGSRGAKSDNSFATVFYDCSWLEGPQLSVLERR